MNKNNTSQVIEKKRINPILESMKMYDKETYPIEQMRSLRVAASQMKAIFGKEYTVQQKTAERTVTVTRIA